MQSSTLSSSFSTFPKPQSGVVYQRSLGLPLPLPSRTGMDISNVLDSHKQKHATDDNDQRRYYQTLQMNHQQTYGMGQESAFAHNPQSIQQPQGLQYTMMAPNQHSPPLYQPGYLHRHDSQSSFGDENYGQSQPKARPAVKQFPCSFADCGKSFARRSDLSRHGAPRKLFELKTVN